MMVAVVEVLVVVLVVKELLTTVWVVMSDI